jgi:2-oxopent-4-enoate hydratase
MTELHEAPPGVADETLRDAVGPGPRALDDGTVRRLAESLRRAEMDRRPGPPPTSQHPTMTLADAYAVQQAYTRMRLEEGATIVGRKVGATNPVIQRLFDVDQPDYGVLFDDMILSDGARIGTSGLIQPRVEVEIAFVLARPLRGPRVTPPEVLLATAALVPCFEIIDSRVEDWRISFLDTVADNGSSARCVLGDRVVPPAGIDLRLLGVVLERNGEVVDTGAGAAALGNPAAAVAWLANTLDWYGEGLEAGHVVLPGALTTAVPAEVGDHFEGHFAGLGRVACRFA